MNILQTTENGWSKDDILLTHIKDALDSTEQEDFVFTVSVQGHGNYPTEKVIENPKITVTGAPTEEKNNAWEYYVNQVYEMDQFAGNLVKMMEERGEPTVVVFYGDHLPTMGLEAKDMKNRYLFQTKYVMWSNFKMKEKDKNLAAYQMVAEVFNRLGIHEGTVFNYHQTRKGTRNYQLDLQSLQYDILYGDRYVYNRENPFEATKLQLGVYPSVFTSIEPAGENSYFVNGENFTASSRLEVNKELMETRFISPTQLLVQNLELEDGGRLPDPNSAQLELVYGNTVITNFL